MTEEFITERQYLKNVSPKTLLWYRDSFKAFEGALDSRAAVVSRVTVLRQRGVSAISVNTYAASTLISTGSTRNMAKNW